MTVVSGVPPIQATAISRFAPLVAFILVSATVALPITLHDFLPLVDLPNHIARFAVMAHPNGPLSAFYTAPAFTPVPNSAVDILWRLTGMDGDPIGFANTVMAVYAVNFVASVMVLSRVLHGRWTIWPAVSGFLVYNGAFFWGFQNFLFSTPFVVYGLAFWFATERMPIATRLAVFIPLSATLFLMHLFAFMALAILAFGREAQKLLLSGSAWRSQLTSGIAMAVPFVWPIAWLIATNGQGGEQGSFTSYGSLDHRIQALLSPVDAASLSEIPFLRVSGYFGLAIIILCFLTIRHRRGARLMADGRIFGPFVALLTAAVLAPIWLNGVAYVHIRLPFLVLAVLIAGTAWCDLAPRQAMLLTTLFATMIGVRAGQVERYVAMHDAEIKDLVAVLEDLPPSSSLLPLRGPGYQGMERLWHAQAYSVPLRQSFVPTLFQGVHALHVKEKWRAHTHPALFAIDLRQILVPDDTQVIGYWRNWQNTFTHALVMDDFEPRLLAGQPLREIGRSGRFALFKIERP